MRKTYSLVILLLTFFITSEALGQGVVVSPTSLTTSEDGSPVQYSVVLTSEPDAGETVTITPSSTDVTEGIVSGALMFTDATWNIRQFVTVTPGSSGDGNDGTVSYNIGNNVSTTSGSYNGITASDVSVENQNVDGVSAIVLDPSSGILIEEEDPMSHVVTFRTTNTPTNDVEISLINNNPTDIQLSTTTISLNAGNGFTSSVSITPIDDSDDEGPETFSITTSASTSADANYNGLQLFDIIGEISDDDATVVAPVPTMGQWGLIVLFLLMLIFSVSILQSSKSKSAVA
ncbi:hypothetical protein [Portibacter lacus]|uniref:Calx-beta domain-containing protein n=1 Tax=Portibacter lacus TaxID=1099794 RepID=A0AA37SSM9_9BACT|nr:hypothetical protein [Portibacter lacus]GLR19457.1 hypothetical protein GCM10007940_40730 [Portibacter lacus]